MAKHLTDFHLPRVDKRLQYKEIFSYSIAFCIQKVNVIYINNKNKFINIINSMQKRRGIM